MMLKKSYSVFAALINLPQVDGHTHVIKAGTVTEESNGHRHRFSSVDNIEIVGDTDD